MLEAPALSVPTLDAPACDPLPPIIPLPPTTRPRWTHMTYLRVAGTGERVPVVAGLFWDQGGDLGTYYSADGRSYLCNEAAARETARKDGVKLDVRSAGAHTGAVACVNYRYDPAYQDRIGAANA